jgi:predicted nuclease of predicted toxin-antitoxin system
MRLLIDMNLSPRWVDVLADAGIEAIHWSALGAYNAPDSEIMA